MRSAGSIFLMCSAATVQALPFQPAISRVRAQGLEVRLTRFAPSPHVTYAIFSGGGLAWADAAMKRGEFALAPAAPGTRPDLAGLSCRFSPIASRRGVILSLLIMKPQAAPSEAFRTAIE